MEVRKKAKRTFWLTICTVILMLCLSLFCACGGDTFDDNSPATEMPTNSVTEVPTEPVITETVTETPTDSVIEDDTMPVDMPTDALVLTFCNTPLNEAIIEPNDAARYEVIQDSEKGSVLKLSVTDAERISDPYVKIDYAAYMDAAGLVPAAWNDCGYALVLLKLEGVTNNKLEMAVYNKCGAKTKTVRTSGTFKTENNDWQYVLLPLVEEAYDGNLTELRFDFVDRPKAAGETVYVKSITFTKDISTVIQIMGTALVNPSTATVVIPGLTKEYKFVHITDAHMTAFSDTDVNSWETSRYNYNLNRRSMFTTDGVYAEDRFPLCIDYANEIEADGIFLTGDIIDFPSEKNISLLYENVKRFKGKSIYCFGNHDWNYSDDYMTDNSFSTNRPLFNDLTNGDTFFSYVEYDEFIVASIDNSSNVVNQETVDKFLALYDRNKPIILILHVPFHVNTLEADVRKIWGSNLTMGPGGVGKDCDAVIQLYNAVCVAKDTPVVAVFSGHVHFSHEDIFPNGVTQYITAMGYTGDCRVVTVKGE